MRIDELRSTLDQDTSAALRGSAHEGAARLGAVHARVARTRRRRRASALGATVAAAVAAVATLVVPPLVHDTAPQPAGHAPAVLAGRRVPITQTSLGYTYDYARGVQSAPGAGRLTLRVPGADAPRLVMWASSDSTTGPVVRLTGTGGHAEVSAAGGFDRYLFVPPGDTPTLHLRQQGAGPRTRLALAVYDLADSRPDGVGNGTVTYRRRVLDTELLAARLGRRGDSDITLRVRLPRNPVWWDDLCYGSKASYRVVIDGKGVVFGRCSQAAPYYDMGNGGVSGSHLGRPGRTATVRVYLTRSPSSSVPVQDPGVVLGIGVYTSPSRTLDVGGTQQPVGLEGEGHEWVAGRSVSGAPGTGVVRLALPSSGVPRVVRFASSRLASRSTLLLTRDGRFQQRLAVTPSSQEQEGEDLVVEPGAHPVLLLRCTQGMTPAGRIGIVVYDLVH